MNNAELTKNIWRNSVSNYVYIGVRTVFGLLMFRMLYQALPAEQFGFWSLLWSVFGYGILLDFGLGFTTMKLVAELSARQRWEELSRVLSTVFYFYLVIGAIICGSVLLFSDVLVGLFRIDPANREPFRQLLILFVCGMGIGFPLAIFPEVLIGLQRMSLVNIMMSLGFIANFLLVALGVYNGWGLSWYTVVGLAGGLVPAVVAGFYARRHVPHLQLKPSLFSWAIIKQNSSFSIIAYINTLSTILLYRKDQVVISTALAVSAVAIYQAAAKINEMFTSFALQLPETFSPAAAHLNASGDKAFLRKLLVNGTRISVLLATPAYFMCAFYLEGLLRLVTGDATTNHETFWVGQVLLLCGYISIVTQSVPRRIFVMCGHEKRLMWLTLSEALLNVVLSVGLVLYFKNIICVPLGSLIATLAFGGFYLWPWAAKEANVGGFELARIVMIPALLACGPLLGFLVAGYFSPWLDFRTSLPCFLGQSILASALAAVGVWRFGLSRHEQSAVTLKLGKYGLFLQRYLKP